MLGELYMVYRLLRETLRRIVGVPPGSSLLATLFAFGVLVNALRRIAAPLLKARRPSAPSSTGVMFALAVPTAALRRITGLGAPDALVVTTTVGVGMVMPTVHAAIASLRSVGAAIAAAGRLVIGRPPAG
ncbi:MAG TPA: hypothetical protein VK721_07165 [Solirubrobacteraceae bacterium]|jgi:hypothetical protein|nr:hypothetical protein [Solirubrobacteraceae bacterium]